jgi:hypothetical protein
MGKRCCICGTAPSWQKTPWQDTTLEVWALNDSYVLGLPRIDRFYELHPFDKMWFRKKDQIRVLESDVPKGFYVRPEGHLEFLKTAAATIPVFLQDAPPADWPAHAHRFPIEAIHQAFGDDYWASGPAYMLAQAVLEGYTDIWITGIHLSTEHEYREQRPNWEHLIGRVLGLKVTKTEQDGFRFYQGAHVRIVMPIEAPILQHEWRYAYETKPVKPRSALDLEWKATQQEKTELIRQLVGSRDETYRTKALARMRTLEIIEMDIQQQLQRQHLGGTLAITVQPQIVPVMLPVPVQVGAHG